LYTTVAFTPGRGSNLALLSCGHNIGGMAERVTGQAIFPASSIISGMQVHGRVLLSYSQACMFARLARTLQHYVSLSRSVFPSLSLSFSRLMCMCVSVSVSVCVCVRACFSFFPRPSSPMLSQWLLLVHRCRRLKLVKDLAAKEKAEAPAAEKPEDTAGAESELVCLLPLCLRHDSVDSTRLLFVRLQRNCRTKWKLVLTRRAKPQITSNFARLS
jgi:hypothetical protein